MFLFKISFSQADTLRVQWRDKGLRIETVAMQFAMAYATAHTTLVGTSKMENVHRNVELLDKTPDWALINEVLQMVQPVADMCWQEGIPENYDPGAVPTKS